MSVGCVHSQRIVEVIIGSWVRCSLSGKTFWETSIFWCTKSFYLKPIEREAHFEEEDKGFGVERVAYSKAQQQQQKKWAMW